LSASRIGAEGEREHAFFLLPLDPIQALRGSNRVAALTLPKHLELSAASSPAAMTLIQTEQPNPRHRQRIAGAA
jgi:hypothetical protein